MNTGDVSSVNLCGSPVAWCESIKYLGVHLQRGNSVKFDINPTKRAFYAACNTIFLHISGVDQLALLKLQETFSLCTRSSAIAERPRCSLFKLWQKCKREKRASGLFF